MYQFRLGPSTFRAMEDGAYMNKLYIYAGPCINRSIEEAETPSLYSCACNNNNTQLGR